MFIFITKVFSTIFDWILLLVLLNLFPIFWGLKLNSENFPLVVVNIELLRLLLFPKLLFPKDTISKLFSILLLLFIIKELLFKFLFSSNSLLILFKSIRLLLSLSSKIIFFPTSFKLIILLSL